MGSLFLYYFMKKISLIFLIILFFLLPLFSETHFSLGTSLSTTFEKNGEYVYGFSGTGVVSYLDWQCYPVCKLGINADLSFENFYIRTNINCGLPLKCGKMYDSDWGDYGLKTTYSISNNYAMQNYDFLLAFSYKIKIRKVYLIPELSLDYYYDFFQSNDGEGWYGSEAYSITGDDESWDSPYAKHFTKLSRIDLKRNSFFCFTGLGIIIPIGNKFNIGACTYISLYSYVYNSDYHHDDSGRNRDFYLNSTQTSYFSRFKELIFVEFKPREKISLDFTANVIFGDIVQGQLEGYEQLAGTDVLKVNLKLGGSIKF